jgi:DNA mismatch repair ATPase MutS
MRVDRATLTDLAILDAGDEGMSLFALLDRSRTDLGRAALHARMRNLPSRAEVPSTQAAIRHLAESLHPVHDIIEGLNPDEVERYLSLKWQASTRRSRAGRLVERAVLRTKYRQAVREISHGVAIVCGLLDGIHGLATALGNDAPALLQQLAHQLRDRLEVPIVRDTWRLSRSNSLAGILEADRLARGRARDAIGELLAKVAELDALCAIASATVEHTWTFPEFTDEDGVLELHLVRRPKLPSSAPNDVLLVGQRVLAITGPNMAGKSTLLKAVATAVYLAHLGSGVPAKRARLSCFDGMLASLYVRDSLTSGRSYYLSEVRRIKELVDMLETTPRTLAILDEPFKGTNIHDATDATALLMDGLCAQESSLVIMATHLSPVVRSRAHNPAVAVGYMGALETCSGPEFDYQLQPGVSDQRLGMILLEREGVAPALASAIARSQKANPPA